MFDYYILDRAGPEPSPSRVPAVARSIYFFTVAARFSVHTHAIPSGTVN